MIDLLRRFCLDRNNISGTTWLTYLFSYPFICFCIQRNNNAFCCHEINRRFPDLLCFPLISCEKKRAEIWAPLYKFFLKWCSAEFATLLSIFFSDVEIFRQQVACPRPSECKSYIFYMHANPFLKQWELTVLQTEKYEKAITYSNYRSEFMLRVKVFYNLCLVGSQRLC